MARPRKTGVLSVYLNGRQVGSLLKASSGAVSFTYAPAWLSWEHTFPISMSLSLQEQPFVGEAVMAVFDNLLPDNEPIRKQIASRVGTAGTGFFDLLNGIGRDCVGALQFLPEDLEPGEVGKIKGRPLSDKEIGERIRNLASSPLGLGARDQEFRISIAGAQEKTALLYHKGKWMEPQGSTPTTHILKPQIGVRPDMDLSKSVENEHFCMTFCGNMGLPVAKTEILDFDGVRVLSVERFDRVWTSDKRLLRLPQEDLCQAMSVPPSRKYESHGGPGIQKCMEFLKASDTPAKDRYTFFKAQIIYWLLGATDGHAKNFSIFMLPGGGFHLAPLYDIMSAQPNRDKGELPKNKMKMAMGVMGNNRKHYPVHTIMPRHFEHTAELCGFPEDDLEKIFDEVRGEAKPVMEKTLDAMPKGFPRDIAKSIRDGIFNRLKFINS